MLWPESLRPVHQAVKSSLMLQLGRNSPWGAERTLKGAETLTHICTLSVNLWNPGCYCSKRSAACKGCEGGCF